MKRLAAFALAFCGPAAACQGLEVTDAWIAEAPPGASALAGYATLHNRGQGAVVLDRVSGRDFDSAMLHETITRGGMAHMEHLERLEVPAGAIVRLNPGTRHLMLVGPKRPLKAGDEVTLHLDCGAAGRDVTFAVRKAAP